MLPSADLESLAGPLGGLNQIKRNSHYFVLEYSRNRLLSIRLSRRKSTLYADLLNNRPKVTLKGHIGALKEHIGALIYILYK